MAKDRVPSAPSVDCTVRLDPALGGYTERSPGGGHSGQKQQTPQATAQRTFLVSALGRVPKWGSAALTTGLLIIEGTDSVLRILATEKGKPSAGNRLSESARPAPKAGGRGAVGTALTWKEGDPAGGGLLCALVVTL